MKSRDPKNQSQNDLEQFEAIKALFRDDPSDLCEKIEAFPKYVSRQTLAKFLTKYELYKRILYINGSIIECGVLHGAGLMAWAKLSSIFEPANHTRRIIGFDTFEGFPSISDEDAQAGSSAHLHVGGLAGSTYKSLQRAIQVYDMNRPIAHIPKVELVKGDLCETAPRYIQDNPHTIVSLLYLDIDLYEPTKKALEVFVPRMPRGAIIGFDELNASIFPGETQALHEILTIGNLKIQRFPFDSYVSYAILQ